MRYLLDTNVISELRRRAGAPQVKRWVSSHRSDQMALSVITIVEIEIGIMRHARHDPEQGRILRRWLEGTVLPGFENRILPVDLAVARHVAQLHVPDKAPQHDALIAGTALAHGLAVATRNVADFAATGVELVDPWSS